MALLLDQTESLVGDGDWQKVAISGFVAAECDHIFEISVRADPNSIPDVGDQYPAHSEEYFTSVSRAVPSGGAVWVKTSAGAQLTITLSSQELVNFPDVADALLRSVSAITVSALSNDALPLTITSPDAQDGDTVTWVLYPSGDAMPAPESATASGTFAWPTPASVTLPEGIPQASYRVAASIGGGDYTASAPFDMTTVAPSGVTTTYQGASAAYKNTGTAVSVDMTGVSSGDWLVIGVVSSDGGGTDLQFNGLSVEGSAATQIGSGVISTYKKAVMYKIACPAAAAGNAAADFLATLETGNTESRYVLFVYTCSVEPALVGTTSTSINVTTLNVSLTGTTSGNSVVAFASHASTNPMTLSTVTNDATALGFVGRVSICGSLSDIAGGDVTITATATGNSVAIAAELGAA